MPPHTRTPQQQRIDSALNDIRAKRGVGNLSMAEFSSTLESQFGFQAKDAEATAVNAARREGNFGQRLLGQAHVSKRARRKYSDHRF